MDSILEEKHRYHRSMRFCITPGLRNTAIEDKQGSNGTMLHVGLKSYNVWPILRRNSIYSSGTEWKVNDEICFKKFSDNNEDPGSGAWGWGVKLLYLR